jgi:hypothetical protein
MGGLHPLRRVTALAAHPSTGLSLQTSSSQVDTRARVCCRWPTAVPAPTAARCVYRCPRSTFQRIATLWRGVGERLTACVAGSGAQFFLTCTKTEWLDDKHVVFGRVIGDGLLVLRKLENVQTGQGNKPKLTCVIAECGEM